ncbi:MAG: DUF2793 domain-containing protein [Pseudomonadota bacterium]
MAKTNRLELPLLAAGQAQKHVTVNEGFARLDALVQLSLVSVDETVPPALPSDGEAHGIGFGASGDWTGQDGKLALFQNGGWVFLTPNPGWQGWLEESGTRVQYTGTDWIPGSGALSASGAGFVHRSVEVDHDVTAGATSTVAGLLPSNAIVYGITARVLSAIGGASSFEIGVTGSSDRYGSGIGTGAGAWARGITGSPLTYYSDTDVELTALGGNFDGTGQIRIVAHFAELTLPNA